MDKTPIPIAFNCGYARVAVFEYSVITKGKSRSSICEEKRKEKFQKLFHDHEALFRPDGFWNTRLTKQGSPFNRYCDFVMDNFAKKWKSKVYRVQYTSTFSTENWQSLPEAKKKHHSLSKCSACASKHLELQKAFPGLPCFTLDIIELNLPSEESVKEASITRTVLSELNSSYVSTFNHSFTTSILKHCSGSENTASKVTPSIKNKNKREICKGKFVNQSIIPLQKMQQ